MMLATVTQLHTMVPHGSQTKIRGQSRLAHANIARRPVLEDNRFLKRLAGRVKLLGTRPNVATIKALEKCQKGEYVNNGNVKRIIILSLKSSREYL